jgi:hypothetical protein
MRPFTLAPLILLALHAPGSGVAQELDEVIPYRGRLELDGTPWSGATEMRFTLYDAEGDWLWAETGSDDSTDPNCESGCRVEVVDGGFEVLLGRNYPLLSIVYGGAVRDLGIEVRTEVGWVELLPRQRLSGVPTALWSDGIRGSIDVPGSVSSLGDVFSRETVSIGGALTVDGDLTAASAAGSAVALASLTTTGGGGDLTTGGVLTVNGDVAVADSVAFGPSANGSGGTAIEISTGLNFGNGTQAIDVRGHSTWDVGDATEIGLVNATINGELRSDHWRLSDDRPLFRVEHFALSGTTTSVTTGISAADYVCWIGGVHMIDGDICENSTADCGGNPSFLAIAMPNGVSQRWQITVDFPTHNSDESHEVLLVCVQARAVDFLCDSDTDGTSYYPSACSSERFFYNVPTAQIPGSWRQ